jgi:hypothetical protein
MRYTIPALRLILITQELLSSFTITILDTTSFGNATGCCRGSSGAERETLDLGLHFQKCGTTGVQMTGDMSTLSSKFYSDQLFDLLTDAFVLGMERKGEWGRYITDLVKILSLKSTKTCTYSLGIKLPCNKFQHIE